MLYQARHRDVLAEGFGDDLSGKADAVFLDLPSPWSGVPHAVTAIKSDGKIFKCRIPTFRKFYYKYNLN